MFRPLAIAAAALALLGGCSQKESASAAQSSNEIFSTASAPAAQAPAGNTGKVLQTQNGGGYTYAEVQTAAGQKVWIAGSQIDVKPGGEVQWGHHAVMQNFQAKSLNRSFSEILFVDSWGPVGAAPTTTAPHGSLPSPQLAGDAAAPGAGAGGTVRSVTNAGGYSYIEVDQGNGSIVWVAANETPMKKGDKVRWEGGSTMHNFSSRSLGRTFESIIFAQSLAVAK